VVVAAVFVGLVGLVGLAVVPPPVFNRRRLDRAEPTKGSALGGVPACQRAASVIGSPRVSEPEQGSGTDDHD
jgi:hypothetical protein